MELKGEQTVLRALESADVPLLHTLAMGSDANEWTTPYWRPWSTADFEQFVRQTYPNPPDRIRLAICTSGMTSELLGVVELFDINWIHGRAELGIIIWRQIDRRKGHGKDAIATVLRWAFETLRLRRIYAKVIESNAASKRCLQRAGFAEEGRWRDHFFVDGRTEDAVLFGILGHRESA